MTRAYNFCAGPATMPEAVLKKAQEELLSWGTSGASVMEMSHRSESFQEIARNAEQGLRDLMHIPDNYSVLFLLANLGEEAFTGVTPPAYPVLYATHSDTGSVHTLPAWSVTWYLQPAGIPA